MADISASTLATWLSLAPDAADADDEDEISSLAVAGNVGAIGGGAGHEGSGIGSLMVRLAARGFFGCTRVRFGGAAVLADDEDVDSAAVDVVADVPLVRALEKKNETCGEC
jgi:hypothetical protein